MFYYLPINNHNYDLLDFYNRENETSSILKTKRAKTLFFSLPFFSQKKRLFFPMFGELERI